MKRSETIVLILFYSRYAIVGKNIDNEIINYQSQNQIKKNQINKNMLMKIVSIQMESRYSCLTANKMYILMYIDTKQWCSVTCTVAIW